MSKIILDLCGGTGAWSKPYADAGYDVRNITLPEFDVRAYRPPENVYGILAAPPCKEFSFAKARIKKLNNPRDLESGMELIKACLRIIWECQFKIEKESAKKTTLKFWSLENPGGFLKYFLGKPVYVFNPWYFGDMYKKKTSLWGWFNKPKQSFFIEPELPKFEHIKSKNIHSKYYGKYNRETRRAITPPGFAKAFFEANR